MFRALLAAYVLGGLTFVPLLVVSLIVFVIHTSPPIDDATSPGISANTKPKASDELTASEQPTVPDTAKSLQGWVTARRTFLETAAEGSYVNQMVRSFLDARSKDPKRTRPKDSFFAVLKGSVLYLYEDELMTDCWAAIQLSSYEVSIHPDDGLDGELFARRNAIQLHLKPTSEDDDEVKLPTLTKEMKLGDDSDTSIERQQVEQFIENISGSWPSEPPEPAHTPAHADDALFDRTKPWFIFVKPNTRMEDWYLALLHHSHHPSGTPLFQPLLPIFTTEDMETLVSTLDSQPDPIPMRWLNALIGRLFFSIYKTAALEEFIISRTMRKLSKVKRPSFLTDIVIREASVGNTAPLLSKPMLKELTKEGEASVELGFHYKGEVRLTFEATASINLGQRFKSYTVKFVLAVVIKEIKGNVLLRVKRPPSNRVWYAFTSMPKLELEVVPVVSDRQIKWSMILKPIESMIKDVIQDSVVFPNMDDIPFFNTRGYKTRGGIFPDAVRKERTPVVDAHDKPAPDTPGLRHAPSTEELSDHILPSSSSSKGDGIVRSETSVSVPVISINGDSSRPVTELAASQNRRSSWFTPKRFGTDGGLSRWHASVTGLDEFTVEAAVSEDTMTSKPDPVPPTEAFPSTPPPVAETPSPAPRSRGASPSRPTLVELNHEIPDPSAAQYDFPLSSSSSSSSSGSTPVLEVNGPDSSPPVPRTVPRLRSPSMHKPSPKPFDGNTSASWLQKRNGARPSSSSSLTGAAAPSTSISATQSTASALLASWKARDKQALSATARETMKKWGWGAGPRKSDPGSPLPSGASTLTSASSSTSVKDEGDESTRERVKSTPGSSKMTYAEMRAQVEERRHNERGPSPERNGGKSRSLSPIPGSSVASSSSPAQPMDIRGDNLQRVRSTSSTKSDGRRRSSSGSSLGFPGDLSPPKSSGPIVTSLDAVVTTSASISSTPTLDAKLISPADKTILQTPAMSPTALSPEPIRPRTTSSPLHAAQPSSAPTMIIPSIHASRRGEVMSLGSSPLPTPSSQSNGSTEPLLAAPSPAPTKLTSIQTMYRLFNKNSPRGSSYLSTQHHPAPQSPPNASASNGRNASADDRSEEDVATEAGQDHASLPLLPPPTTARPVPPPLPPRPQSSTTVLTTTSFPGTASALDAPIVDHVLSASLSTSSLVFELSRESNGLSPRPQGLIVESLQSEAVATGGAETMPSVKHQDLDPQQTQFSDATQGDVGEGMDRSEDGPEQEKGAPGAETADLDFPETTSKPEGQPQ